MTQSEKKDYLAPLRHIGIMGYSLSLCRLLLVAIKERQLTAPHRKADQPYIDAEVALMLSDPTNIERYILGDSIRYRNHKTDSKGRVTSCEAYFETR